MEESRIKNNKATRSRLFVSELQQLLASREYNENGVNLQRLEKFLKVVGACMVMETIFYMPNCFRQTILVNSNHISFVKPNDALLDLMNVMFRIDKDKAAPIREFRVINFLAPYKTFFNSTLFYEGIIMGSRMGIFEFL